MPENTTHILLDAARMGPRINEATDQNPHHVCLYRDEPLQSVAPYLFEACEPEFNSWFRQIGWGQAWGILLASDLPMNELQKHFRKFLFVSTDDDQELYFRFYDPRVLRVFLPTCDVAQLELFFAGIRHFIIEDDAGNPIKYWLNLGQLMQSEIPMDALYSC